MTDTIFSLNEAQFQKLVTAQRGWWPVVSVFVSALLAMAVGILLDLWRARRERKKGIYERQEHEVQQINATIAGLTFNIELLLHIASQNILPHFKESWTVYNDIERDDTNPRHLEAIIISLSRHEFLFMTCPPMYLVEIDFARDLPFIIEHDPMVAKLPDG